MTHKASVLVVDDEVGVLESMMAIFESKGYQVNIAENGVKAVDLLKKNHVDIALLDIVMPEMNGVETFRKIKEMSPDTKVIMITGYGREHPLVEEALNEGVEHLLNKPVNIDKLLSLMESIL